MAAFVGYVSKWHKSVLSVYLIIFIINFAFEISEINIIIEIDITIHT